MRGAGGTGRPAAGDLSRSARATARVIAGLPAHEMPGAVERPRQELGLPMPWQPFRPHRRAAGGPGNDRPAQAGAGGWTMNGPLSGGVSACFALPPAQEVQGPRQTPHIPRQGQSAAGAVRTRAKAEPALPCSPPDTPRPWWSWPLPAPPPARDAVHAAARSRTPRTPSTGGGWCSRPMYGACRVAHAGVRCGARSSGWWRWSLPPAHGGGHG